MPDGVSRAELAEALEISEFKGDTKRAVRELERRVQVCDDARHLHANMLTAMATKNEADALRHRLERIEGRVIRSTWFGLGLAAAAGGGGGFSIAKLLELWSVHQ